MTKEENRLKSKQYRTTAKYRTWHDRYRKSRSRKNTVLNILYGLTVTEYETLLKTQDNACKICRQVTPLVVDHSHTTGKVRGLICRHCNLLIGHAREEASVLKAAIDYLE